ncbi:hypothetical protein ACFL96_06615 [Thermoproteota archaeon]
MKIRTQGGGIHIGKKAQFYLFTMIILLALVTTFIIARPVSVEVDRSMDHYFENLEREAEYVINNALINDENVSDELNTFFTHMQELGKTRRLTLTYFYLVVEKDNFTFYNDMDSDVFVIDYNLTLSKGGSHVMARPDVSKLGFQVIEGLPDLSNFIYKFYITDEDNQLLYLLFVKRGDQYDLHIRDNT